MIDRSLTYGRHHIANFLRQSLPYKKVLDIGAGSGADLECAKQVENSVELFALEYYQPNIEMLREKKINVFPLNIENSHWPFEAETMDIIIANQILEHTKEIFWIFHECSRVLAIGGKMIIGVPNLASLHNRLLLCCGKQPTSIQINSAHIRGFTKQGMLRFIDQCFPNGYKLKSFGGGNFYPFPPALANPLAYCFPTMAWGTFFLFEKQRVYREEFLQYPVANQLETNFFLG